MATLQPPVSRRSVLLGLGLGVPCSAVFLWLAVRKASLGEVWAGVRDADAGPLVGAVLVMALVYSTQAVRWREIASRRAPFLRFLSWIVSSVAINNVIPARVGDVLRARWIARDCGEPLGRGVAFVIVDRAFDVLGLGVLLAIGIPRVVTAAWAEKLAVAGFAAIVLVIGVLLASRTYTSRRARERRGRGRVRRLVRDTLDGLSEPFGPVRLVGLGGLSVLAWGLWGVAAILVGDAVGIELDLVDAVFVTAVVNLGVAIPSSPGFVGTYQWLCVSSLGVLSVGREQALSFAILLQASWYVPTTLVGAAALGWSFVHRARAPRASD
ncbi:MAG: lysylphosphatidylglycerol synthase transmembrane domain-containing protein [Gaiella sp.]